jgi:protein TonB
MVAPDVTPDKIPPPQPSSAGAGGGGVVGGVEGGVAGGVLGGVLGGDTSKQERKVLPMGSIRQPKVTHKVNPIYPPAAQAMGLSGRVVLELIINERGQVENARILQSNNPIFNQSALTAVKKWRYSAPTTEAGQRVSVYQIVTITFKAGN